MYMYLYKPLLKTPLNTLQRRKKGSRYKKRRLRVYNNMSVHPKRNLNWGGKKITFTLLGGNNFRVKYIPLDVGPVSAGQHLQARARHPQGTICSNKSCKW